MDYAKKLAGGSLFIFFIAILSALVAFFTRVILARNLTNEEVGLFFAVFVFVNFFTLFRNFGLGAVLIKKIPEFQIKNKFVEIKSIILTTTIIRLLLASVIFILFLLMSDFLAIEYFGDLRASLILKLLGVFFVLSVLLDTIKNLFEAFQKPFFYPLIDFLKNVFVLLSLVLFLFLGLELLSPVFAYILSVVVVFFIFLNKTTKISHFFEYKSKLSKNLAKESFIFGLPFLFIGIAGVIIGQVDTLLLTYFRSLSEVGIYNIILPTSLVLLQFSSAISVILFPLTSEMWARKEKEKLFKIINLIYKYSFVILIPLASLLFIFASQLIELFFGTNYLLGVTTMRILLLGVIFYSLANMNQYILAGIGKPKTAAKIVTYTAIFNFIGNLFLIPKYGIEGAAIITTLSYILSFLMSIIFLRKLINFRIKDSFSLIKIFLIGGLMIPAIAVINKFLDLDSWIIIIPLSVLILLIYFISLLLFKIISISEIRKTIKEIFR